MGTLNNGTPPEPQFGKLDILNRIAMGGSSLGIALTTMFTALAATTHQTGLAIACGTGAVLQGALGALNVWHVHHSSTQRQQLAQNTEREARRCKDAWHRLAAIATISAATLGIAQFIDTPPTEVKMAAAAPKP